jgi:hypothetical protein
MTSTLPGADIRGYYRAIGVQLPEWAIREASVRCFTHPDARAHDDRRPSCLVDLGSGAFPCWGCGAEGGACDAAIEILRLSPREAIDLMIECGLAERRAAGASGHRTRRPARPTRHDDAQVGKDGVTRAPGYRATDRVMAGAARRPRLDPPGCVRPEHRRLWDPVTLRHLGIGWDGHRLTIPIRDIDGHLQGLLRYAPMATRTAKMIATPGTRLGLIPAPRHRAVAMDRAHRGAARHDLGARLRDASPRRSWRPSVGQRLGPRLRGP